MKNTLYRILLLTGAVLLVAAAGCTAPSESSSPSAGIPAMTAVGNDSGTPALPSDLPAAPPLVATKGDTVAVYYTGTYENGTVFDSNMNATAPVSFTLGNATVIDGFEEAVNGMVKNQQKTVNIPAEKAYGAYNASLVHTVNRTGPIADTPFTKGQYYSIHDKTSDAYSIVKILNVTPTTVTWDGNNPLAGLNFTFTIKLVSITRP